MMRIFFRLAGWLARLLPTAWVEGLILTVTNATADSLSSLDGLRFLFRLDNRLYETQSRLALRHEGGAHPKHRITRYHDFFVARVTPGERILDVGCGQGALAFALANRGQALVTGIDLSPDNIDSAKRRYPGDNPTFIVGDALAALPQDPFDVVVLSNVLEHLPKRVEFLKRLQAATQAQRFLARVPLIERDWRIPLKRELGVEWRTDPTHQIEYELSEFKAELAEADLNIDELTVCWGEAWAVASPSGGRAKP